MPPEDSPDTTLEVTGEDKTDNATVSTKAAPTTKTDQQDSYEERYKGLQRYSQKQQEKLQSLETKLEEATATLEEMRQQTTSSEKKMKTLEDQIAELDKERDTLKSQVASHQATQGRMNLILAEFPDLAKFEAEGLLPQTDGTEESMREVFNKFRTAVSTSIDATVDEKLKGIGAKAVGDTKMPPRDKWTVERELNALAGRDDQESRAKFNELQKEWDDIHKDQS